MGNMEPFRNRNNSRFRTCMIWLIFAVFILFIHFLLSNRYMEVQRVFLNSNEAPEEKFVDLAHVEKHFYSMDQKSVELIQYTRLKYLTPPSQLPYKFKNSESGNKMDQFSRWVAAFFENKTNGVFIEAGANEGEIGSHSLYLEKVLGWTGLLVECNPTVVPYLKSHHRKAWIAGVCLAPSNTPGVLNFSNPVSWSYSGTFRKPWKLPLNTKWTFFDVDTIPLYTVLAAIGLTEIDYFSFDIEGMELAVLKSFPFDLITFKVLIVEIFFYTEEENRELDDLLTSNGYHFATNISIDKIYVHNSVKHLLKEP